MCKNSESSKVVKCENCGSEHDGMYGSGRFCSRVCVCTYSSNKNKKERGEKISKSLKGKHTGDKSSFHKNHPNYEKPESRECPTCKNIFISKKRKQTFCSKECINRSLIMKGKSGGYRENSGRGKSGWYKDFWCNSSYELAYVIYCLEHDIKIERNLEGFDYEFESEWHKFYPDFLVDGKFVELKNYKSAKTDAKINQFPQKITILYGNDLKKEVFPYVIEKYGKNFIELYKDYKETISKSRRKNNFCEECGEACRHKYCSEICANKHKIGKKKLLNFLLFDEARKIARNLQFKTRIEWDNLMRSKNRITSIPVKPKTFYKKEWISWNDWFGI